MKRNPLARFVCAASFTALAATSLSAEDKPLFRFPGGDVAAGEKAFVALNCVKCHTVAGANLAEPKGEKILELELGANPRYVKNYEDLIRAIVNPKHVVNEQYRAILTESDLSGGIEALMPDLTKDMSARQLVDLVVFLDRAYKGSLAGYGE
ncbi:MAG: c-type cytochrome [Verrucomicrobiales bacterium]|jgi:mono/diheme cytochrome c family protein|nr:c-type cytochrome [Verrucomicrobiales bacterium]